MKYIFHYNGDCANIKEYIDEGYTYHEHLSMEDGKPCNALKSEADSGGLVEAFFEDGNELSVYIDELEEV